MCECKSWWGSSGLFKVSREAIRHGVPGLSSEEGQWDDHVLPPLDSCFVAFIGTCHHLVSADGSQRCSGHSARTGCL